MEYASKVFMDYAGMPDLMGYVFNWWRFACSGPKATEFRIIKAQELMVAHDDAYVDDCDATDGETRQAYLQIFGPEPAFPPPGNPYYDAAFYAEQTRHRPL
jgi:hypothetical protein